MDLFPDWGEIGINVKVWMVVFHAILIAFAYLTCFKIGRRPARRLRKACFAFLTATTGFILFVSMFVFDWESVLP